MAELLSVHVHIPLNKDQLLTQSKGAALLKQTSQNDQSPTGVASKSSGKYDLPRKRNFDIEFRDLKYSVKDGHHKGRTIFNIYFNNIVKYFNLITNLVHTFIHCHFVVAVVQVIFPACKLNVTCLNQSENTNKVYW